MERKAAIQTFGLAIGYSIRGGRRTVHPGLDLALYPGELTCLLGRNGAGKSTLLKTLCGLLPPLGGEVFIGDKPLRACTPADLSSRVGVVLTDRTQAGGITVYDLVSLGRYPHTGFFGSLREADHEKVREAIAAVGLAGKEERHVAELSDGERQKAFIAKVLAQECPVILLDEPTAFLDVTSRIETMLALRELARKQDKAVLLSTHDLDTALQLADRLWLLPACDQGVDKRAGKDVEPMHCGTPDSLVADGTLARFFESGRIAFDPVSRRLVSRTGK